MGIDKMKLFLNIVTLVGFFLFTIFFFSTAFLGGSAFNDATNEYELYQPGHYYLVSHGDYTEVSYEAFVYAQIIEVIGISAVVIGFIVALIKHALYP